MSSELQKPPYLDWVLDRWKIGVILLVFGGLAISALAGPSDEPARVNALAPAAVPPQPIQALSATLPATSHVTPVGTPMLNGTPGVPETAAAVGEAVAGDEALAGPTPSPSPSGQVSPTLTGPVLPLTLANVSPNAIVPEGSVRLLAGTAASNALVEVRDQWFTLLSDTSVSPSVPQEAVLGVAVVDEEGIWQLGPFEPLAPGQHVLSIYQMDDQGVIQEAGSPVVVTVLAAGEEGPLSLATPSIRFPGPGARLPSGPLTVVGTGLPGMKVRLYLDNRQVAEGMVTAREEWRLTPNSELAPGVYTARVAALNLEDEIVAESAPVAFVVQDEPLGLVIPVRTPTPTVPLTISSLSFGDRRRQTLVVRGKATPHAGISAWIEGEPVKVTNAATDGGWQVWLYNEDEWAAGTTVEIRSSFGERLVAETETFELDEEIPLFTPMLLRPKPGDVLTTRRPVLMGLAQPASEVAVVVNNRLVARVIADQQGLWAHQLVEPLPPGNSTLTAAVEGTWTTPDLRGQPILVALAPRL